jgi:hypothetical protein
MRYGILRRVHAESEEPLWPRMYVFHVLRTNKGNLATHFKRLASFYRSFV